MCTRKLTAFSNPSGGRPIFGRQGEIDGQNKINLPCGKCDECLADYIDGWATRGYFELLQHEHSAFITLTYSDQFLPHDKSLKKKDVQDFLKRLRRAGHKVRYTYCGEYGERSNRAHYHIILYGYWPKDAKFKSYTDQNLPTFTSRELTKLWPWGFHEVGYASAASIAYLYKYALKKVTKSEQKKAPKLIIFDDCEYEVAHEFIESSRNPGIGGHLRDSATLLKGFMVVNGYKKPLPRYLLDSIKKSNPALYAEMKETRADYALKNKTSSREDEAREKRITKLKLNKKD